MELSVKTLCSGLCPKLTSPKQMLDVHTSHISSKRVCFSIQTEYKAQKESRKYVPPACAVLAGAEDVGVSSSPSENFSVTTSNTNEARELKISVEVPGVKTREIFDDVFDKMVAAAQPIPGFRRVKGGKTPNIPKDVLLEVLGPSKVYKEVIKKIINTAVGEYVQKEGLKVYTKLRVEQSFEDLEEEFEPGEDFSFDAVIQLQETN